MRNPAPQPVNLDLTSTTRSLPPPQGVLNAVNIVVGGATRSVTSNSILTPDRYSSIWRVANAMLRDNKISMGNEKVRTMHDDAAIGWSLESGFFDVGVVNSISGVGRTWEKNGGRVIARSPDLPNMPLIASRELSAAQVAKLRAALLALNSNKNGQAVLKRIGLTGFKETSPQEFLDFLRWLGDLEVKR